jgi:hypothetical protein
LLYLPFRFLSFAGGIAGVASGLPLRFQARIAERKAAKLANEAREAAALTAARAAEAAAREAAPKAEQEARDAEFAERIARARALRRSMAVGLSAADLARAARSNWAFFASAAVLRRSAKSAFLDLFISLLIRSREAVSGPKSRGLL